MKAARSDILIERDEKISMLPNIITTSAEQGMISMDRSLKNLYENGVITYETALSNIREQDIFRKIA
jgi:Tfp pilus assembly pilus retraction ATPase PilT